MSNPAESSAVPMGYSVPVCSADPRVPLQNLSAVRVRMDSLQQFLSDSVYNNNLISKDQMEMISVEISSAIHQIIVNGAALLACSQPVVEPPTGARLVEKLSDPPDLKIATKLPNSLEGNSEKGNQAAVFSLKVEERDDLDVDCDIVELDAVELLAEHVHFCEICGKGFKRDANLRMHMRAHGNQFKTPEALAKPDKGNESSAAATRKTGKKTIGPRVVWQLWRDEEVLEEGELLGNCTDNGFFEGLLDGFASIEGYNLEDVLGSTRNGWGSGMEDLCGIGRS
ncbi:hypothetical protein GH714_018014 [Hevea brasiliensis]|uniref:C2H2-type domain-containing protein n=1 Tax=Hevea brasiliensis TaxID=3981 RepID=A0A6A6K6H0_HEVBR|nr:hypothetical protein GH714_018014 [Hevea brasiliensis]